MMGDRNPEAGDESMNMPHTDESVSKLPLSRWATVCLLLVAWAANHAHADLVINEIDVDQIGTDRQEFVEIHNTGPAVVNFNVSPHVLVFFNGGDGTPPVIDGSYRAVAITGSIASGGFLVLGGTDVPNVDIIIGSGTSNLIQNGPDAVAIYSGTLVAWKGQQPPTQANLVDAIAYGTGDTTDNALLSALGLNTQYDEWDDQGSVGSVFSIARSPDGGPIETGATPTPGVSNDAGPPVFAVGSATLLQRNAAQPATVTLLGDGGVKPLRFRVRSLPSNGTLRDGNTTITGTGGTTLPYLPTGQLTYRPDTGFAGVDTFAFDAIDAIDRVSPPSDHELAVQSGGVVITEVMHTPGTSPTPQDQRVFEYVELFNLTNQPIELVRFDTNTNAFVDTTDNLVTDGLPAVIPARSMRIIAPGGLTEDSDEAFRCEWGLLEEEILRIPADRYENMYAGSRLLLVGDNGVLLDAVNFFPGDFWEPDLDPDIFGASQSIKEAFLFGQPLDAAGNDPIIVWPYSGPENVAGLRSSYSGVGLGSPGFVTADLNEDFIALPPCPAEALGGCCLAVGMCSVMTVGQCDDRGGSFAGDHVLCGDIPPCPQPPTGACCTPAGDCILADPFSCGQAGGTYQGDNSACSGANCPAIVDVVINEIEYDQVGADTGEYVELFGPVGRSLFGFKLWLYNGQPGNSVPYREIAIVGFIQPDAHFVIGSASVPNVDQIAMTADGIQNGSPDGIAITKPSTKPPFDDIVIDTIAYGGSFIGSGGPAAGVLFPDIGVVDAAPDGGDPSAEITLQRIPDAIGPWSVTTDGGTGPDGTPGTVNGLPLPVARGACCLPVGTCIGAQEPQGCDELGGEYQGEGSDCGGGCSLGIGACCLPGGDCVQTTVDSCGAADGEFRGEKTLCFLIPPCSQPPTGACCLGGGGCVIDDSLDCANAGGDFQGVGSACGSMCGPLAPLKINEIHRNDASIDDREFIEILGPGGLKLSGLAVIEIEGDRSLAGQQGRIDSVWLLGATTIPADGYLVLGDAAVPNVDVVIGDQNQLENGTATFLLIDGFSGTSHPPGTDIDSDNDGVVDAGINLGTIVDAIALADDGLDAPGVLADRVYFAAVTIGPIGASAPAGVARRSDGLDSEDPDDFCILGVAGDGSDGLSIPTPGVANICTTCTLPGDTTGDGTVDLLDFAGMQRCFTDDVGPITPPAYDPSCVCADLDADGDVDLLDFVRLRIVMASSPE
jgi:hypothetical protein